MKKIDPRMITSQCHGLQPVHTIHENNWFSLMDRGGYYTMEYHSPQIIVLPIIDGHSIVMVKVKRPVIADNPLELPAGAAKKDEPAVNAAARELHEETGIHIIKLDRFELLPPIVISPNRYPMLPWIYKICITHDEFDSRDPHDDEIEGIECLVFDDIKRKIICGDIYISLPLAIISRFLFQEECLNTNQ
jgi:8-oxo-dGTP pyrophosphatase MutT (NUDIX family)